MSKAFGEHFKGKSYSVREEWNTYQAARMTGNWPSAAALRARKSMRSEPELPALTIDRLNILPPPS
ncbi:MAG TPA: hypothetical protein VGO68_19860 [Pyrinomonadaceae bacterium]|jgi:hypothetical protein|nr:hypothetical protein [Pyrinomonadaceae bacterium]